MGISVSKNIENKNDKKTDENIKNEKQDIVTELIHKMYPWKDITIGANPIFPDNHVHHLRRTLELNEKTYQSWINSISDSEQEDKSSFNLTKNKKTKKKIVKPKIKVKRIKNYIEPSKNLIDNKSSSNQSKKFYNSPYKLQPFTFTRVPTPQSKFLISKNYEHL
ncbi:Hypothetical protein SRAE_2000207200 [Strongyloides ratti]|uniref:Uncharacterized protein n=1 Tax=Strongyloides ratti TaxID=34506 RepID=A0A090LGZ6_STRRB|nr:Hypothetical protein SRAE_2000207200 [Strongyloides ratti]CEF67408.1 Hypothetical protein SRAE_2000207200 [Strongyloides ratti]